MNECACDAPLLRGTFAERFSEHLWKVALHGTQFGKCCLGKTQKGSDAMPDSDAVVYQRALLRQAWLCPLSFTVVLWKLQGNHSSYSEI